MPVTANQIQMARKAGYSDDEIVSHLAATEPQMKTAINAGYSPAEIMAHFDKGSEWRQKPGTEGRNVSDMQREFIANEGTLTTRIKEALPSRKTIAQFARPILEGTGAVGGAILGGGGGGLAGLAGGPAAPGTVPYGAIAGGVAGAGLGYAAGKNLADTIEGDYAKTPTEAVTRSLKDIGTGAMFEMGGQLVSAGAGAVINKGLQARSAVRRTTPAISTQGINAKAGQILQENMGTAPIYEQNAKEAGKLNIPGYKPSLGESRNDPGLIKLQRGLERNTGPAANMVLEQKAANQEAVREYLANEFKGTESIDDVITALNNKKAALESVSAQTGKQAEAVRNSLNPADVQTTGRAVVETIEKNRIPAKTAVNQQYDELPNQLLPTSQTAAEIKSLKKDFRPGDEDVYPSRAISRIEEALQGTKPKAGGHGKPGDPQILGADGLPMRQAPDFDPTKAEVGFQNLHSLRKDLGRQIQDATTGANPNRELAMKLKRLQSAVDSDIEAGMGRNNEYDIARNAFKDYANKFRTGEIAKITQRGKQATGLNIPDAQIAKRVFTPDGADDFIRAVGKDGAAAHIDGYAAQDLLSKANPLTGEVTTTTAASWINKNASVLKKYGLFDKYNTVAKTQAATELAKLQESQFTKSAASKLIGSDVDKALDSAFSTNPKNTSAVVSELITQMKGDKQAVKGLQNAFKDFVISKAETTAKTITGDNIISPAAIQKVMVKYAPAMRVLYKNEPTKIAALNKVSKAVEIQSRSSRSPLGGGSDTAENLNVARGILSKVVDLVPGGNTAFRLGRMGLDALNNLNAAELNKVLARAMYDADLAQTLLMAAKRSRPEIVQKRINSHLVTLGMIGAKDNSQD